MILNKKQLEWISRNREIIGGILDSLIEDRKNQLVDEEDTEKQNKLRSWIKELRLGLIILRKVTDDKTGGNFTGI